MKRTSQERKSGRAGNVIRSESNRSGILVFRGYIVNHALAQWRKEAQRLFAEYRRTGDTAHLRAFRVHRAAMGARLRGRLSNR